MKTQPEQYRDLRFQLALALVCLLSLGVLARAAETAKTFPSPDEAVSALVAATSTRDTNALHALFGPAGAELENPDRVQSTNELSSFATAYKVAHRLVRQSDSRFVLEVGADSWPFPVPIVSQNGRWFFDTEAGKDELLSRRIGKNELSTIEVMRAYVDAQREYASRDRDGDGVLEYAQRISSSAGQTDGLYWPPELNHELSPLGPLVAQAQTEGYFGDLSDPEAGPQPFHGYLFKILTAQGKHASGGKRDYVVKGNMTGGFALVAWPSEYGQSGVMTFIVNQDRQIYQKDLGGDTAKAVKSLRAYNPDPTWQLSTDGKSSQ